VTQQNSATAEELSATAEELSSQAEHLQHTIAFFQVDAQRQTNPELPIRSISVEEAGATGRPQRDPDAFESENKEPGEDELDEDFEQY
jgi:methyl-accepting chemotaxis protein